MRRGWGYSSCLAGIIACAGAELEPAGEQVDFASQSQELRSQQVRDHRCLFHREVEVEYAYSFNELSGTARIHAGQSFTIWDELGGCGDVFRDVARCESDGRGRIRAFNHDCLSEDGPGTFGPWVREGCSVAQDFGYVVECCRAGVTARER